MSGPEASFRDGVHRHLPPPSELHREGMANPYRGGTPDFWYSGKGEVSKDLWVEWKHIVVPVRANTMIDLVGGKKPVISGLQQEWIKQRHAEGRNAWVIVGSPEGGVVLKRPDKWQLAFPAAWFRAHVLPKKDIARAIDEFTRGL